MGILIPLAVPNLNGNGKKYLDNCIDTTYVSSVGAFVTKFEDMVAEAIGSQCGADPQLMDINAADWCLDSQLVRDEIEKNCESAGGLLMHKPIGKRVAAVMPVYTLGNIPDMEAFRAFADEYGLPLAADAACAIGATYHTQAFGPLADLSVLSFNGNKTVTCGGGGVVVYAVDRDRPEKQRQCEKVRPLTTIARVSPGYDFDGDLKGKSALL